MGSSIGKLLSRSDTNSSGEVGLYGFASQLWTRCDVTKN